MNNRGSCLDICLQMGPPDPQRCFNETFRNAQATYWNRQTCKTIFKFFPFLLFLLFIIWKIFEGISPSFTLPHSHSLPDDQFEPSKNCHMLLFSTYNHVSQSSKTFSHIYNVRNDFLQKKYIVYQMMIFLNQISSCTLEACTSTIFGT